ncbi:MAG: hypothetical protein K8T20_04230 [Planctomycetes bacterium]|nr:hypothetical protein [Planctomycetota bacterium]
MNNAALSPESIGRALFREQVLSVLAREIRTTTDLPFDQRDVAEAIYAMLTPEAREEMGPPRGRKPKPASSIVTIRPMKPPTKREMAIAAAQPPQIYGRIHDHTPPPTPPPKSVTKPATKSASKRMPPTSIHAPR